MLKTLFFLLFSFKSEWVFKHLTEMWPLTLPVLLSSRRMYHICICSRPDGQPHFPPWHSMRRLQTELLLEMQFFMRRMEHFWAHKGTKTLSKGGVCSFSSPTLQEKRRFVLLIFVVALVNQIIYWNLRLFTKKMYIVVYFLVEKGWIIIFINAFVIFIFLFSFIFVLCPILL